MNTDLKEEQQAPLALVTSLKFNVSTDTDYEKMSIMTVEYPNEVSDPRLGFPNFANECSTCGARNFKSCDGHFGVIKFPHSIVHPYYISEVVQVLNKVCPGCKSITKRTKGQGSKGQCKYCTVNSRGRYPKMRFRVSPNGAFGKSAIIVEWNKKKALPADYWDFIPPDEEQVPNCPENMKVLSHAQVYNLLKDINPELIKKHVSSMESIFLSHFPVTPNSHRVTEITHSFSNGQRLIFDERTRAYKKLVDFRGTSYQLGCHVLDCLNISKLHAEKPSKDDIYTAQAKSNDSAPSMSGLRYMKDVILGKRNDHCFRMVVVGNPSLELSEIGIPCRIAEKLQISEQLNPWNWEKIIASCELLILEKGELRVRRKNELIYIRDIEKLQAGDAVYRPLTDGDVVMINRPPSIHQHSVIALNVKILPVNSVLSINPLICSPFRGDFDGDCLHGYVPQSVETRVELNELAALDKQLINSQSGRNLLSLSHDSLTAASLVKEDGVCINLFQMQQLQMFCPNQMPYPAIVKAPSLKSSVWTGKQLLSMLLPPGFNFEYSPSDVLIRNGELMTSSEGSNWFRDADGNLFEDLIKHYQGQVIKFLYNAQEVLCELLSVRGLSVSLQDLYVCADPQSHDNLMSEIFYGLQEAEQACDSRLLMVDSSRGFLAGDNGEDDNVVGFDIERLCSEKQRSAALSQAYVDAFKDVFRDVQNLAPRYAIKDNSFLTMIKAGSKGNMLKFVQHSLCLGLQHALVPLSFTFPHKLSCSAWNNQRLQCPTQKGDDRAEFAKKYIPSAVIGNSFLAGLNPLECFVHSVTSRDSSFSDNADLPGSLSRRLMFFMRDLYGSYDGTVRNPYGNQLVQFSYDVDDEKHGSTNSISMDTSIFDGIGGEPLGSLSACAISEAAYSALDQPISPLESSPLLNLKRVLECGSKKLNAEQTITLFLSEKLGRKRHGFEFGALRVKDHLERLFFSDIVSTVSIIYSPQASGQRHASPWVCHFHVKKETIKRRMLEVQSIIDSLQKKCNAAKTELRLDFSKMEIANKECCSEEKRNDMCCITVVVVEASRTSSIDLDLVQCTLIPYLLGAVVKGFEEIKKVDILWLDGPKAAKSYRGKNGELYLRVSMSGDYHITKFWSVIMDDCLKIMDLIDWTRSHPDNIRQFCTAFGIDAGWKFFLNNLKSAISDTGKSIQHKHLLLVANCLSSSGEFVGLNSKGLAKQRDHASVKSPFMQACFSNPSVSFVKAAKTEIKDDLQGTLDALAWGSTPHIGTGGQFDIVFSMKEKKISEPLDVYNLLGSATSSQNQNKQSEVPTAMNIQYEKWSSRFKKTEKFSLPRSLLLRSNVTVNDILRMSNSMKNMLRTYQIDEDLSEADRSTLVTALNFHPRKEEKIGSGFKGIKVINHPEHKDARCFSLVRMDGTVEDFSYHKCVLAALEIIAPKRARSYGTRWLQGKTA